MLPGVVMKFGGTSVGTAEAMKRTARHVAREPRHPLVVVSAVGGVTDLLLQAAETARSESIPRGMEEIHVRHHAIIDELGLDAGIIQDLEAQLMRLVQGISLLRELTPRIKDSLVSLGERMSSRLLAATLESMGRPAMAYNAWELGLYTDDNHGCAEPLPAATDQMRSIMEDLDPEVVPVVTGFIGHSTEGEITTLGRGGSDFSAALFGAAVGAAEIQIWTDVSGIQRADPRVVEGAEVIGAMRFEEAAELAYFGAKVLHPRTMEPARRLGIPVRVLGTFAVDPDGDRPASELGTVIDDQAPMEPVRALAIRPDVQSLHIHSLRMLEAHGFLSRVFEILTRHRISVDVIATSEVSISMTLDLYEGDLAAAVEELKAFAEVEELGKRSIVCLVGSGLRQDTSLLARIFDILARADVPVHVISQGASRINITLVTDPEHVKPAMKALYDELF